MNLRFNLIIGSLFILAGLLLSSPYLADCYKSTIMCPVAGASAVTPSASTVTEPTATSTSIQTEDTFTGFPTYISIPNVNIGLGVVPGTYDKAKNDWTIGTDKAYFATVTSEPNKTAGNTFIYGHNRSNVFGNLSNIQIGDKAIIQTDSGHSFTYEFSSKRDANPNDISILHYDGQPILTLQTCSGLWDQYRRLFTFNLVEVL